MSTFLKLLAELDSLTPGARCVELGRIWLALNRYCERTEFVVPGQNELRASRSDLPFVSLVAASSGEKDEEARSESAFWQFAHAFNQHTMGVLKGSQYEMSHEGVFILASGGLLDTSVKTWFKGYEPDKKSKKRARVETEDNLGDPE